MGVQTRLMRLRIMPEYDVRADHNVGTERVKQRRTSLRRRGVCAERSGNAFRPYACGTFLFLIPGKLSFDVAGYCTFMILLLTHKVVESDYVHMVSHVISRGLPLVCFVHSSLPSLSRTLAAASCNATRRRAKCGGLLPHEQQSRWA